MKRFLVVGLTLILLAPYASAGEAGENQTIDVTGTPIDAIVTPDASSDGEDFTVEVTLGEDATGNGTTVHWTVQMCSNDGTCDPPIDLDMTNSDAKWSGTIEPINDHSYVNYDVILKYTDGDSETFPESGFVNGGKVWSDCWVAGSESGGDGCDDDDRGFLGLPAPALIVTALVGFSAALVAKRDD